MTETNQTYVLDEVWENTITGPIFESCSLRLNDFIYYGCQIKFNASDIAQAFGTNLSVKSILYEQSLVLVPSSEFRIELEEADFTNLIWSQAQCQLLLNKCGPYNLWELSSQLDISHQFSDSNFITTQEFVAIFAIGLTELQNMSCYYRAGCTPEEDNFIQSFLSAIGACIPEAETKKPTERSGTQLTLLQLKQITKIEDDLDEFARYLPSYTKDSFRELFRFHDLSGSYEEAKKMYDDLWPEIPPGIDLLEELLNPDSAYEIVLFSELSRTSFNSVTSSLIRGLISDLEPLPSGNQDPKFDTFFKALKVLTEDFITRGKVLGVTLYPVRDSIISFVTQHRERLDRLCILDNFIGVFRFEDDFALGLKDGSFDLSDYYGVSQVRDLAVKVFELQYPNNVINMNQIIENITFGNYVNIKNELEKRVKAIEIEIKRQSAVTQSVRQTLLPASPPMSRR